MNDEKPSHRGLSVAVVLGAAMVLFGGLWLVMLMVGDAGTTVVSSASREPAPTVPNNRSATPEPSIAPSPEPSPAPTTESHPPDRRSIAQLFALGDPLLVANDLGTGSVEFSGVALNESTNRLMVADDEGRLFEFDLTEDGEPITPARRTLRVDVGAGDIEGIAWMFRTTYVLAHENDGGLTIVEIDDGITIIGSDQLRRTIDTGVSEENGNGIEGVTYLRGDGDIEFAVVDERPPTLHLIDGDGEVVASVPLDVGLLDVSDVWIDGNGIYWILSDEARVVMQIEVDAIGTITKLATIELDFAAGRFEQPEGIVGSSDGSRLYVVGEGPGPGRFALGFWTSN